MPKLLNPEERLILLSFLDERFGMSTDSFSDFEIAAFSRQAFLLRRQKKDYCFTEAHFVRCGLPFLRDVAGYLKPTTAFVQRFGHLARKNVLDLDFKSLFTLAKKGVIQRATSMGEASQGYVILKNGDLYFGIALLIQDEKIVSRFPKALKQALARLKDCS